MFLIPPKSRFCSAVGNGLFNSASLDLRFAQTKSLVDATTGQNLVTFTRASSGTYVDSTGTIQRATTNLWTYSEQFEIADWVKTRSSITTNTIAAPNGTLTADTLIEDSTASATHQATRTASVTAGLSYTWSLYCKTAGRSSITLSFANQFPANSFADFNLSTGTITSTGALGASNVKVQPIGDGWYRLSITATASSTATSSLVAYMNNGTSISYTGDGTSGIYLWGAQLEQSSTVGEYIPTTSTINSAPRFDHNPTTGESLGLLGEESRTNLCLQSEDFSTTWGSTNYTVTTNATTAPNGTITADKLIRNTTDTTTSVTQNVTVTANTAYNYSIFVKASEWSKVGLREGSVSGNYVTFDLSNGTIVSSSVATGAITAFANGWYRIAMQMTTGAAQTTYGIRLIPLPNSYTSGTPSYSFTGDGTSGLFAWGAQLEAGAFPTSYIPTTTAAVTRSADVASISGSNFSSWYRQDEGTVFVESRVQDFTVTNFSRIASLDRGDATANFAAIVRSSAVSRVEYSVFAGTGQAVGLQPTITLASGSTVRSAFVYRTDDFLSAANGILSTADTTGSVPTSLTTLGIGMQGNGSLPYNGPIRRLTYWPQRLNNSILQSITQ